MPDEITHIRGDTFTVTGQFQGGNFTGWTGASQVRDDTTDELLSTLIFTWVDATQGFFHVEVKDTSAWPKDRYVVFDVEITSPTGNVRSSSLQKIRVLRDATYA